MTWGDILGGLLGGLLSVAGMSALAAGVVALRLRRARAAATARAAARRS